MTHPDRDQGMLAVTLGRDENIHIMITPLDDVGSYNNCHNLAQGGSLLGPDSTTVARYCPLWAYHFLTVLFLGTHEQLPSGSPIMGLL